ncbi:hypothetical protein JZU51_02295 [bacterium]|nr:hypothetical protein [bacterium]
MRPSTLIAFTVASLGLTSAAATPNPKDLNVFEKRKCFESGVKYGDEKGEAQQLAKVACRFIFQGTYKKRQYASKCYNLASRKKSVKFAVALSGPNAGATRYLGLDECYDGLHKEVVNCGRGGETTYGNWYYRYVRRR